MEISVTQIKERLQVIREKQVLLDSDLAEFYGTETRIINQAVKRNPERFPHDFMFRLTEEEFNSLKALSFQTKPQHGGRRSLPHAFTQLGVSMLSSVLNNGHAVEIHVLIMRAFVQLQQESRIHTDFNLDLKQLIRRNEEQFQILVSMLQQNQITNVVLPKNNKSKEISSYNESQNIKVETIIQTVANYFNVTSNDIRSSSRVQPIALSRQILVYLIRTHTGCSLKEIGRHLEGKDHSTLIHAYKKISSALKTDPKIQTTIRAIEGQIIPTKL